MPRSSLVDAPIGKPGDLLACSGGRARTSTSAVSRGRGRAARRGRCLDAGTEGGPNDIRTHDRAARPHRVRDTHVRGRHVRRHPVERRLAPGSRHLPARRISVRSVPAAPARSPLPGDALGQAFERRHARAHGDAAVRGLPRGHRRGPSVVAARGARGAGDRGSQLRARDHRVGGCRGEALKTPICATTSCQVYRGIPVPFDPSVRRWFAAVRRTSGEVLLYGDRPADTVYFSTSNGRTYGNDEVFGSAPLPYLRPVTERDDGASPVSHWRVRVPFDDLATFLHEAGEWAPQRTISSVGLEGSTVTVRARSVALDGPDHLPRRRQRLGTLPEAGSLPALPAPGDAPIEVDDTLLERGRRRGRRRTRLGSAAPGWCSGVRTARHFVGSRPRTSSPTTTGGCGRRPIPNRADPRPGRERPHLGPRRAVPTRRSTARRSAPNA